MYMSSVNAGAATERLPALPAGIKSRPGGTRRPLTDRQAKWFTLDAASAFSADYRRRSTAPCRPRRRHGVRPAMIRVQFIRWWLVNHKNDRYIGPLASARKRRRRRPARGRRLAKRFTWRVPSARSLRHDRAPSICVTSDRRRVASDTTSPGRFRRFAINYSGARTARIGIPGRRIALSLCHVTRLGLFIPHPSGASLLSSQAVVCGRSPQLRSFSTRALSV